MSDPIFTSLTVTGPAAITGNLSVGTPEASVNAQLTGSLNLNRDNGGVGGNISAPGTMAADSLRLQGAAVVGAALEIVAGGLSVAGSSTLNGPASVSGALTLTGALNAGAGATISGALSVSGATSLGSSLSVGGSSTISGQLSVSGSIAAGNSDIYFTNIFHNHTGFGNNTGHAAIENARDYNALMILGRSGTNRGRYVRLWDYLQVNGSMDVTGNLSIGLENPRNQLHVLRGIATGLDFTSAGSITFYPPDGFAWFHIDNGPAGGRPQGRLRFSHGGSPGGVELMYMDQSGNVVVPGRLIARNKVGFVADQFVNGLGATLEAGDVVVIGRNQSTLYFPEPGGIPAPEVDLADQPFDTRVCGVVVEAFAAGKQIEGQDAPEVFAPGQASVAPGQIGLMVTLGAVAVCKVDASSAPIEAGDLLTTSATPGHAQKASDPARASGAILGKALGALATGTGTIPVFVSCQ